MIRKARESVSVNPAISEKTTSAYSSTTGSYPPYISGDAQASSSASASNAPPQMPSNNHNVREATGPSPLLVAHQQTGARLATSLSGRQLLNQRLQKYKLPAVFRVNLVGPAQEPRWKGSFWIKDTLLGTSRLEHSKTAAKEGAAMSALKWLNNNHYY
jgi:hypothetical protein